MNATECSRCADNKAAARRCSTENAELRAELERLTRVLQAHGIDDPAVTALEEAEAEAEADERADVIATFGARHWRSARWLANPPEAI